MRIISGNLKGRKIAQPNSNNTRPLKDLTKESIFNIMEHSNLLKFSFEKSTILDLFSGVGSFGLECISRGAKNVIFLDPPYKEKKLNILLKDIIYLKLLKKNGIIIIHRNKKDNEFYPKEFKILKTKIYGISKIIFGLIAQ